jgi:hypothetical protein
MEDGRNLGKPKPEDKDRVGPNYYDAQGQPLFEGRDRMVVENEGYAFGREMSQEERYRNRDWDDFEDELRLSWKQRFADVNQRYADMSFDASRQDIIRGWTDGLVGPDPEGMEGITGTNGGYENTPDLNYEDDDSVSAVELNGEAPLGDLGNTVRIVSADEMEGKIDMHYVDDMDDLSDLPDIENEGNRGDNTAHLE